MYGAAVETAKAGNDAGDAWTMFLHNSDQSMIAILYTVESFPTALTCGTAAMSRLRAPAGTSLPDLD